jgi:hypothetical protein
MLKRQSAADGTRAFFLWLLVTVFDTFDALLSPAAITLCPARVHL